LWISIDYDEHIVLCAALASSCWHRLPYWRRRSCRKPARVLPRYGMLVFSDLCIHPDSGEFGGQRITLQRFAEVDTVLYEYTAGGLSWPVVASDVTIDPRGQQFYFTVQPPDEDERTISGKLVTAARRWCWKAAYCDESVPMRLARVTDFGRKAGTCRACPAPKNPKPKQGQAQPSHTGRPCRRNPAENRRRTTAAYRPLWRPGLRPLRMVSSVAPGVIRLPS
jgi:hypothetical protein